MFSSMEHEIRADDAQHLLTTMNLHSIQCQAKEKFKGG